MPCPCNAFPNATTVCVARVSSSGAHTSTPLKRQCHWWVSPLGGGAGHHWGRLVPDPAKTQLLVGSPATGEVNGVNIVALANSAVKTSGDQTIAGECLWLTVQRTGERLGLCTMRSPLSLELCACAVVRFRECQCCRSSEALAQRAPSPP